jgi:hypothetical protein
MHLNSSLRGCLRKVNRIRLLMVHTIVHLTDSVN